MESRLDEKTLRALEFDKIVERLAAHTGFSVGRELALALRPSADRDEVVRRQRMTAEARSLLAQRPSFSTGGARDVRMLAGKAARDGVLEPAELLEVAATLDSADIVRSFVERLAERAPLLLALVDEIEPLPSLVAELHRCIDERGEVTDVASPALGAIRREVRSAHDALLARVNDVMRAAVARGLAQEPLVTQREGRYVIPVKADFRGQLPGVVHDVSQSGATLFVEPLEIVEMGNRHRELLLEEQREIDRVLRRLSADIGSEAAAIERDVELLGEVDLALAKARFGEAMGAAALPGDGPAQTWIVAAPGELRLVDARHPLLTGDIVPISLHVGGDDVRALLVTGPNTGGKTVALKTAGLLALMAQAGLPIPAEEGSRMPVFSSVHADIGDEQSIEQSLSTFSSHITKIVAILRAARDTTLVLLDELAAGTDPAEGAPLARAILEELLDRGCVVIATTHHGELKAFAHETPGIVNGSVEFDPETLAPTYRVIIGLPGGSNAFAIARRLGMDEQIVRRAEAAVGPEQLRLEDLLSRAQRERDLLGEERRAERIARDEAEAIRDALDARLRGIEQERERAVEEARAEIEHDLREARLALRRAEREMRRLQREGALQRAAEELRVAESRAESIERRAKSRLRARRDAGEATTLERIAAGDRVWLAGLPQPGEALGPPDDRGEIEVMLGSLRTKVRQEQVRRVARAGGSPVDVATLPPAPRSPGDEIEVRGQTLDEALPAIDTFIDRAFRAGVPRVRIVHGKGTGTLRRAVRDMLTKHPLVRSIATPPPERGGEGVTEALFSD